MCSSDLVEEVQDEEELPDSETQDTILSLMEPATTSAVSVFGQLHPCRISVPYSPDSRLLAMTIVLRLLEFFALFTKRQRELRNSDSSITNRTRS